jgi:hypothetical protein
MEDLNKPRWTESQLEQALSRMDRQRVGFPVVIDGVTGNPVPDAEKRAARLAGVVAVAREEAAGQILDMDNHVAEDGGFNCIGDDGFGGLL